jgi:hypothetical protein
MNGIFEFLLWCVIVAVCVGIGMFVIQIGFGLLMGTLALIISGISWICQKLSGK